MLHVTRKICYKLVGLVVHHQLGIDAGGHYTSFFIDSNQNQWFNANDAKVN